MPFKFKVVVISIAMASTAMAAEPSTELEDLVVTGVRERLYKAGMLKDVIEKTEVINDIRIEQSNAANLTEAIQSSPGVRVNNECSMCGVKRVMLNGLRGEHTTVLIDGIPMYTMLSGFYGLDAAATSGLQSIEIARGAGASLTAPEAIGGTINLISKIPSETGGEVELAGGQNGYKKAMAVGRYVSDDSSTRLSLSGQYDDRDQYDGDSNGVSENPAMENQSLTLLLSQDFGDSDNVMLRFNRSDSEVFGGPDGSNIGRVKADFAANPDESAQLFVDDDVRKRYIGHPWETAEWIDTSRNEYSLIWLHEFSEDWLMHLNLANVNHEQNSFYEGFSYDAENSMNYIEGRINYFLNDQHLLSFGVNIRAEENRSLTSAENDPNYTSDSFDYDNQGFYIQDTINVNNDLEVSLVLRADKVKADFIDPKKPGAEIDEDVISPRVDLRYMHNDYWTSRFSYGQGYRAPLSFFESDHGLLDAGVGFLIEINELERSQSANYALTYTDNDLNATASLAYTNIENLASLTETEVAGEAVPTLQQAKDDSDVWVMDLALSYRLTDDLTGSVTVEKINYNDSFKQGFGVVPIEERITFDIDWDYKGWDVFASLAWVGSRNLSEYGTVAAPTFDKAGLIAKSRDASAYWTANFKVSRDLNEQWQLYFGANNLFDYTQVNDQETPLFYDDGGYDVADIYSPLRGREAYAGIKYAF